MRNLYFKIFIWFWLAMALVGTAFVISTVTLQNREADVRWRALVASALTFNAHRIHYDAAYTTEVEQHPGVVIDGPLQGDWLSQCALNWLGDAASLVSFTYSNRRAAYLGETLTAGGRVTQVDRDKGLVTLELSITNEAGEVITPGGAQLKLSG